MYSMVNNDKQDTPSGHPPVYQRIGGEVGLHRFVDALYDTMDALPQVRHIRAMHPADLDYARDRLFMFLSGMLGGPPLYMEAFGHPRLRRKHLHFEIGDTERDQWMLCAEFAADRLDIDDVTRRALLQTLAQMADHLRNQGEHAQACPTGFAGTGKVLQTKMA